MKNVALLLGISASLVLTACDNSGDDENKSEIPAPIRIELSGNELKLANEGNAFAAELFSLVNEDKNLVISPLSLNMALAMVWNGANGETKSAIQNAMGMENYQPEEVNTYFKKLRETFIKTDPTAKLAIANSIWSRKNFPVKTEFYNLNKEWYNAEVRELDFSDPAAPGIINQWCSDNTNGLIKDMISEISPEVMMYLINALYFKGIWSKEHGFKTAATTAESFYTNAGKQVKVKMMQQNNQLGYYSDEYLTSTALPYGNGSFSMVFILPNQNVSSAQAIEHLKQPDSWYRCMNPGGNYDVNLFIPKFKIEYENSLNEALSQLGMGIAFSGSADFSGISDVALQISTVKQKACIEVNEEGSEAAAVTAISIELTSVAPSEPQKVTFRADRPFLFAIKENSTGTVLFMGKIENPE
jgi:serpin B